MLREIIIPKKRDYNICIPEEYLNKRVEILVLPLDDNYDDKQKINNESILKSTSGILKNKIDDPVQWQKSIRSEWDDRI